MDAEFDWMEMDGWTDAELEHYLMGPFDGGIPGLVRRIRRILDVSQRGLAAVLDVSQSVVARWETGRTSPRADVLQHLLTLAGLRARYERTASGTAVEPMRDDGARDRAGRRFPAHVDLTVIGWRCPRGVTTSAEFLAWRSRQPARRDPAITFHLSLRRLYRLMYGTPVDHPSHDQLVAEAEHLDEVREQRRRQFLAERPWLRPVPGWAVA